MGARNPTGALPEAVRRWVEMIAGQPIAHVERMIGGASRASAILTFDDGSRLFLRRETGSGPLADTPFTLERERALMAALAGTRVPVPRIVAFSAALDAMLMEVVPGFTSYQRTLSEGEEAVIRRELIEAIIALQAIDPTSVAGLATGPSATVGEAWASDLALWTGLYRERVTPPDPLIDAALAHLGRGVPDAAARAVIVHGDLGPGNFLIDGGHVAALIDWEMVRIGHPLEDLACVMARALGSPFGTPAEHIANFEAAGGGRVDPQALDDALIFVFVRWLIAIAIGLQRPEASQNVPMLLAFRQIDGRSLLPALLRRAGMAQTTPDFAFAVGRAAGRAAFDWCRAVAADITATAPDPADRYRLDGMGGLLAFLDMLDRYGGNRYEAEETERIAALLGRAFDTWDAAVAALCAHLRTAHGDDWHAALRHVEWRVLRDHAIMRGLMGARADVIIDLPVPATEARA